MSSPLCELNLKTEYRSDVDNLLADFYLPCLQRSILYCRAVGYFTSRGLSAAAQGISALINSDGQMLLVASPLFDPDDVEAIEQGYSARDDLVVKALLRQIEATPDSIVHDRLGFLAWLIAEERLEIRIAIPLDTNGIPRQGIYHEKLGIFSDRSDDSVAFTGSPNETAGGLVDNFETIDVFWSWDDPHQRVVRKVANFDKLWHNDTAGLSLIEFPDAVRQQLLKYKPQNRPAQEPVSWVPPPQAASPFPSFLWEHQIEAIQAWEDNQRTGLMSMATGSGKTLAALVATERCANLQLLTIAVPRSALVEQWAAEAAKHTDLPKPVLAYETAANWQESLFNRLRAARRETSRPVVVIGTLHSLSGKRFQTVLDDADIPENSLMIVDEVHNVGAPTFRRSLRDEFKWRLGLSATPARFFDEEGTQVIADYFGSTVYVYDLRRALLDGHLCPYRYYVYPAHLSDDEYAEYNWITHRIMQLRGNAVAGNVTFQTDNAVDSDSAQIEQLLFRRARILKKCAAKLGALESALTDHPMNRGLVYCADNEQLADVTELLRRRQTLHLTYTADTASDARRSALDALGAGHIPA